MRKRVQKTPVYGPSENHTSIETIPTQQTSGDISTLGLHAAAAQGTGFKHVICVNVQNINVGAGTGYARMNN